MLKIMIAHWWIVIYLPLILNHLLKLPLFSLAQPCQEVIKLSSAIRSMIGIYSVNLLDLASSSLNYFIYVKKCIPRTCFNLKQLAAYGYG